MSTLLLFWFVTQALSQSDAAFVGLVQVGESQTAHATGIALGHGGNAVYVVICLQIDAACVMYVVGIKVYKPKHALFFIYCILTTLSIP